LLTTKWNIKNGQNLELVQVDQKTFFAADSDILSKTTKDGAKDRLENGNYILTVHQNFVIVVGDDGKMETALISMSGSQGKSCKKMAITSDVSDYER